MLEKVAGNSRNYSIYTTSDIIYLDNDSMESITGITCNIMSKNSTDCLKEIFMSIAKTEEYGGSKSEFYLFNEAYYWMEEQKESGSFKEGSTVRVYGEGSWGLFDTYSIKCTKIELLNSNKEVISTFEYKK